MPAFQASDDGRDEHRVGLVDSGVDDPRDPLGRWRLDPLALAMPEQQDADVLDAPLVLRDVRGEPGGDASASVTLQIRNPVWSRISRRWFLICRP